MRKRNRQSGGVAMCEKYKWETSGSGAFCLLDVVVFRCEDYFDPLVFAQCKAAVLKIWFFMSGEINL